MGLKERKINFVIFHLLFLKEKKNKVRFGYINTLRHLHSHFQQILVMSANPRVEPSPFYSFYSACSPSTSVTDEACFLFRICYVCLSGLYLCIFCVYDFPLFLGIPFDKILDQIILLN